MKGNDTATFYVRTSPYSTHVKQVFTNELTLMDGDQPAVEIDLSIYDKNDSKIYDLADSIEQFVLALAGKGTGSKRYFENVFIFSIGTGVFIEATKASKYSWADEAMNALETALENLTGGDQVNFQPFEAIEAKALAGAGSR